MSQTRPKYGQLFSAKGATGVSTTFDVRDFTTIYVAVTLATSASLTMKCYQSIQKTEPTFSSSASASNIWSTVEMVDLEDEAKVAGDTGIVCTGSSDGTRTYAINTGGAAWIAFDVTAFAAGTVSVYARATLKP